MKIKSVENLLGLSPAQKGAIADRMTESATKKFADDLAYWRALGCDTNRRARSYAKELLVASDYLTPEEEQVIQSALDRRRVRRARASIGLPSLADRLQAWRRAIRYGIKLPRTPWRHAKFRYQSADACVRAIESCYRPGYTAEPYVQMIAKNRAGTMRVVAEFSRGCWLSPLAAAGFVSRRVA